MVEVTDDTAFAEDVRAFIKGRDLRLNDAYRYANIGFMGDLDRIKLWLADEGGKRDTMHAFRVFADIFERLEMKSNEFEIVAPTAAPRVLSAIGSSHLLVDCHVDIKRFTDNIDSSNRPILNNNNIFCHYIFTKVNTILDVVNEMFSTVSIFWSAPVISDHSYAFLYNREFESPGHRLHGRIIRYEVHHSTEYGLDYQTRYEDGYFINPPDDQQDSPTTTPRNTQSQVNTQSPEQFLPINHIDYDLVLGEVEAHPAEELVEYQGTLNSPEPVSPYIHTPAVNPSLDRPYYIGCARFIFIIENRGEGSRKINTLIVEKTNTNSLSNYLMTS